MNSIVRFLKNKNTVTVIGVIVGVALLWGVYYYQLQKQVKPKSVPVAAVTIQPRTEITSDMITYVDVPEAYITENAITDENQILNMYSYYNTVIPAGSMFYSEALTTKENMPNDVFNLLDEGEIAFKYAVDFESTFANSIMPNDKIDLYMAVTTEEGTVMLGRFLENVEVLAVKDSEGNNVFEVNDGSRTPAYFIFGLQQDIYLLLMRAQYIDVEFIVVPHGAWIDSTQPITLTTQELTDYIKAKTVQLSSDTILNQSKNEATTQTPAQ